MANKSRLTVIGAGAMGSAIAGGVISAGLFEASNVTMSDIDTAKLQRLANDLGVSVTSNNTKAVADADVILLAVKPGLVNDVLSDIQASVPQNALVISIAAGVKVQVVESGLRHGIGIIRAMPNTPCQIGAGAIAFSRGGFVTDAQAAIAKELFNAVGESHEVPEKLLDAVTGLSGSGPAYVYIMIEAMADAGVRVGLPRNIALPLAAQTVLGSAMMVVEQGEHPARLKDAVTSPGGTTIAGVDALEHAGFRSAIIEAVKAATKRSEELG